MLVKSIDDIKSTELIICRFACCNRNELVVLCDSSDRTNHKVICPLCERVHEIDMNPVFYVETADWDWDSKDLTKKSPKDDDILKEVKKIDDKFMVR